jgi:hypothetical protein
MQPLRLRIGARHIVVDMNVPIVLLAAALLLAAVLLFWLQA